MKTYRKYFEIFAIGIFLFYLIFPLACSTTNVQPNNVEVSDTVMVVDMVDTTTLEIKIDTIQFASFPYSISDSGKQFIKDHEKLRLNAYDDPSPTKQSIGWGHQIKKGENYKEITEQKANEIFEDDIELVNASINRLLKKTNPDFKYTQNFIDGLGSLIFNCGEYGVSTTDFYKRLLKCRVDNSEDNINESDLHFTLAAVKTSKVFCEGHKKRRMNEYNLMIE
jgi:GH24 family phage-related lysozyme (muramidase)